MATRGSSRSVLQGQRGSQTPRGSKNTHDLRVLQLTRPCNCVSGNFGETGEAGSGVFKQLTRTPPELDTSAPPRVYASKNCWQVWTRGQARNTLRDVLTNQHATFHRSTEKYHSLCMHVVFGYGYGMAVYILYFPHMQYGQPYAGRHHKHIHMKLSMKSRNRRSCRGERWC